MNRLSAFLALANHAWLGNIYKRLTRADVQQCVHFLNTHAHANKDTFALAAERWHLDDPNRPTRLSEMIELLTCANSALPTPTKELPMDKLGTVLAAARTAKDLTREQVAKKLGITPAYYAMIENNKNAHCSDKVLGKLVKLFGIKADLAALQLAHNANASAIDKKYRDAAKAKKAKAAKKGATKIVKVVPAEQAEIAEEAARLGLTDEDLIEPAPDKKARKPKAAKAASPS